MTKKKKKKKVMLTKRVSGLPGDSVVKNPYANTTDKGLSSESGRSPGGGNCSPLQYSCLENAMNRGASWATVRGVAELDTTEHGSTEG